MTQDREAKYDEIVGLIARHAERLLYEDLLFHLLRKAVKELVGNVYGKCLEEVKQYGSRICRTDEECHSRCVNVVESYFTMLPRFVYAEKNEPVRIGSFRTLLHEVYFKIYGEVRTEIEEGVIDMVLHGIMREEKPVISGSKEEVYNVGIDYVWILCYPNRNPRTSVNQSKVCIPLFIIAKSGGESEGEIKNMILKLKRGLDKAIEATLKHIEGSDPQSQKVVEALKNMKMFARVVLTRTTGVDIDKVVKAKHVEELKRALQNYECLENVDGLMVYKDISCGLVNLVLRDIPEMYEVVANNEALVRVTARDWITVLVLLGIPVVSIDVTSAESPPSDLGGGGIGINSIVKKIQENVLKEVVGKVDRVYVTTSEKTKKLYLILSRKVSNDLKKVALERESMALDNRRVLLIEG